jgi:tRNA A58 N-methylase Trm61
MNFESLKWLHSGSGSTIQDYKFLYGIVSLLRPRRILEIGTNVGVSAIVMAQALRDEGVRDGKIYSVDIDKGALRKAKEQIENEGLLEYIELIHGDVYTAADGSVGFDLVFLDGDHTYEGIKADFGAIKEKASYILIHDSTVEDIQRFLGEVEGFEMVNLCMGPEGEQWSKGEIVYRSFPGIAILRKARDEDPSHRRE